MRTLTQIVVRPLRVNEWFYNAVSLGGANFQDYDEDFEDDGDEDGEEDAAVDLEVLTTVLVLLPRLIQTLHKINPLTSRVKPWVIQSFLTFDCMDRTLKCDHSLESC